MSQRAKVTALAAPNTSSVVVTVVKMQNNGGRERVEKERCIAAMTTGLAVTRLSDSPGSNPKTQNLSAAQTGPGGCPIPLSQESQNQFYYLSDVNRHNAKKINFTQSEKA